MIGDFLFVKGAFKLDPIFKAERYLTSLYGTENGKIPFHIAPEFAQVEDEIVLAVPNQGGSGAVFDTTAAGPLPIADGYFRVESTSYLSLPSVLDLMGARLFLVAAIAADSSNFPRLFGKSGTAPNTLTRVDLNSGGFLIQRGTSNLYLGGPVPGTELHLFEFQLIPGRARAFVDGNQVNLNGVSIPAEWGDYPVDRIFAGSSIPGFAGIAADVLLFKTDGSPEMDAIALNIRKALADKNNITLAG